MIYLPGLAAALAALWFALSGQTGALFLVLAAFSVLASLWLAARLDVIDRTGSPWHRLPVILAYIPWLAMEVVKSNITVVRAVFSPGHALRPALVRIRAGGRSDLAKAMFANSITLTPGTVTVDIENGEMLVHALDGASASPESFADMDRLSARAAGEGRN